MNDSLHSVSNLSSVGLWAWAAQVQSFVTRLLEVLGEIKCSQRSLANLHSDTWNMFTPIFHSLNQIQRDGLGAKFALLLTGVSEQFEIFSLK